jgi:hypothetical protein
MTAGHERRTVPLLVRRALYLTALAPLAAGLAACAQPGTPTGAQPITVAPVQTAPAGSPGSTAPAAPPPSGAAATSHGLPAHSGGGRCASGQLVLTVTAGDSAAGHIGLFLVFTNASGQTCTLDGYPGVSLVNGSGTQINDPATWSSALGGPAVVSLAPGAKAHANLLLVDTDNFAGNPSCQPVTAMKIKVYPPANTVALFAATTKKICKVAGTGVPQVFVVQAGSGG